MTPPYLPPFRGVASPLGDGMEMSPARGYAGASSGRSCCTALFPGFDGSAAACLRHGLEILGQPEEVSVTKRQVRGRH